MGNNDFVFKFTRVFIVFVAILTISIVVVEIGAWVWGGVELAKYCSGGSLPQCMGKVAKEFKQAAEIE